MVALIHLHVGVGSPPIKVQAAAEKRVGWLVQGMHTHSACRGRAVCGCR